MPRIYLTELRAGLVSGLRRYMQARGIEIIATAGRKPGCMAIWARTAAARYHLGRWAHENVRATANDQMEMVLT